MAATASMTSAGPLTRVDISDELNCTVDHVGDAASAWFDDIACGTFLSVGGELFGPTNVPAGSNASPLTGWTPVSQSAVAGAGTQANPFRVTTVVAAGTTGVRVSQVDSYVVGEESYTTDTTVINSAAAAATGILYRAGDCYLQDSDYGYGSVDTATGAVACTADATPGSRIEQLYPLTGGSHYLENSFGTVWGSVGSQAQLPDTCDCATAQDNGIALSWAVSLAAGASKTYSSLVTFSPLGRTPLSVTKTANSATVTAGGQNGYTIQVTNHNVAAVTLDSLTDTLPAGFSYRAGTTSGATTTNPTVSGQNLSWASISVPAGGVISLHFGVMASTIAGTYSNSADGLATGYTVIGTGPTAPVTVTDVTPVNRAPVGQNGSASTPQNTAVGVTLSATDADGDPLTYTIVSAPSHGTVTGTGTNRSYTPATGYTGTDSFTFKASDGQLDSNTATISLTVSAVTPSPTTATHPSPPRRQHTTAGSGRATLYWTAPLHNGGAAVDRYQVRRGTSSFVRDVTPWTRRLTFTHLRNGSLYRLYVRAHNAKGYSGWVAAAARPYAPIRPRDYANCASLNRVYPQGVGRPGARDRGGNVTNFTRSLATYRLNTESDRDHDGIACERR